MFVLALDPHKKIMAMDAPLHYIVHLSGSAEICCKIWGAIDPPSRKSLQSTCFLAHSDTRWYVKSLPSVLPDSSDEENDGHPPVARPRRTG